MALDYYAELNVDLFGYQAIASIAESWEQITLDIGPYKDRGHFRLKYEQFTLQKLWNLNLWLSEGWNPEKCVVNIFKNKDTKLLGWWVTDRVIFSEQQMKCFSSWRIIRSLCQQWKHHVTSRLLRQRWGSSVLQHSGLFSDQTEILSGKIQLIVKFSVTATCCKN